MGGVALFQGLSYEVFQTIEHRTPTVLSCHCHRYPAHPGKFRRLRLFPKYYVVRLDFLGLQCTVGSRGYAEGNYDYSN